MRTRHPFFYSFKEGIKLARPVSSDQYVEKGFLYLLVLSLLLHLAGFAVVYLWPRQPQPLTEPTFIDLQDMTQLPTQGQDKARPSDQRRRVIRETAPKADMRSARPAAPATRPRQTPPPGPAGPQSPARRPTAPSGPSTPATPGFSARELVQRQPVQPRSAPGGGGGGSNTLPTGLMPSASRMAKLEEGYRRRFADDLAEGDTSFLNTDSIQFGSFLRRFETSVYGVWRYPQQAALKGIEGVTPVKITFNRKGEIVKVQLLESSGSKILDDEVLRTLREIGPMGSLPKNYTKDEFHLIAFFQYGNARGRLR